MTSGSGPSSRMLPASRKSTLCFTHSYMMPLLSTPASTACADAAEAADAVDRPQVMLVAGFDDVAAVEAHAEAGAEQGLLDVVRGQGVAGEQPVDVAAADQRARRARRCRCGRSPGRRRAASCRPRAACGTARWAIWRMATPLGFSVETVLFMNSNACCSTVRFCGNTRTPAWPTTIGQPALHVGHRQAPRA